MAYLTIHLRVNVPPVTEEDKVREPIKPGPSKDLAFFFELSQFLDGGAVLHDALMTTHTFRDPRYLKFFTSFQLLVANVAFHSCLTMAFVTDGDRLHVRLGGLLDWLGLTAWSRRNRIS
jgi:hypothetical protein